MQKIWRDLLKNKRASIDIGSNSCLLLAGDFHESELVNVIANESRVTGLGRMLDKNGHFLPIAMEETYEALSEYKNICEGLGIKPEDIIATATEASRVSSNAKEFYEMIEAKLGIRVTVISGEAEAYYSTKGILIGQSSGENLAIMDIGGASTEFILVDENNEIKNSFSIPIGSVRATNWLEDGCWEEKTAGILKDWQSSLDTIHAKTLQCVAGTMTSLANMHLKHSDFVESEVHGHVLTKSEIKKMSHEYENLSPEEFLAKFPFLGKRSAAIRGGLILASWISELIEVEEFKVSTYGLRYGTLLEGSIRSDFISK